MTKNYWVKAALSRKKVSLGSDLVSESTSQPEARRDPFENLKGLLIKHVSNHHENELATPELATPELAMAELDKAKADLDKLLSEYLDNYRRLRKELNSVKDDEVSHSNAPKLKSAL